ncbi:TonB-dependent receptor [Novosphingobium piscinae]|uniref:TonB-dependent receptor n=1 Tax=Novosphingobium piscinae TaxID=1507448 RepID=A0A7X1FVB0_9SPHN|nr:TonB-dependent receptor [Novosphingobium piscinae]MBC2667643.1 TonB-dependent receptor [Novosphingobium piscinae]
MRMIKHAVLASTSLLVLACAAPAWAAGEAQATAADEASATADEDGAIVVTARRRAETLLQVPVSVSVATAEQLARDQVYTLTDLQRLTPALEVSQTSGGENNGGARLRGLGTAVFNSSVTPSVAFVVDDVPQGNLAFPQLFDMGQVEVLRGPQGTLFGQSASAGVVNVRSVAPSLDGFSGNVGIDFADKGTAGAEYGLLVLRGAVNAPLSDTVAVRVAGQLRQEKGLQRNIRLGNDSNVRDIGVRGRLLAKPTETLTINLTAEYNKNRTRGTNFFVLAIAPTGAANSVASNNAFTNPAGNCGITISARAEQYCSELEPAQSTEALSLSGMVDLELGDLTLTSITSYRKLDREVVRQDFTRLAGAASARSENLLNEVNQFTQELRGTYKGKGFDVVGGLFYARYNFDQLPLGGTFGSRTPDTRVGFSICTAAGTFCIPGAGTPTFTREDTQSTTYAAFADVTVNLTDQVDLFGGLRYTDFSTSLGIGLNRTTTTNTSTIDDKNLSGRIGLRYQPNSDLNVYASYARGYKSPALVVNADPSVATVNLKAELADAFEVGVKYAVAPGIQLEANAYYNKTRNFQSQNSQLINTQLVSVANNIPSVSARGIELSAFGRLGDHVTFNTGYQYNVVKYPSGFLSDDGANIGGRQLVFAPRHKASFSGEYFRTAFGKVDAFLNANVVYKSATLLAARVDPRYNFPAHATIGGAIGLRDSDNAWRASIFVRNLTKQREPTAYLANSFAGAIDGGIRAWPVGGLTARVVGLSFDASF